MTVKKIRLSHILFNEKRKKIFLFYFIFIELLTSQKISIYQQCLSSQVERYGPYTAPYTDPLSGAEIRTVTSLKWDDLRPYFHSIRPRITMPKNGTVYGAVYYENTAVNRPILMMLRSVFLRQINGPYTDRIVRPG